MIALVCLLALAHTTHAQEVRRFKNPRNRTSHVRIVGHVNLQEEDTKIDSKQTSRSHSTSDATWFRMESTSTNQCVAVLNGNTEYDTLIHLTDCDDSDKTLWTQSTDDYFVRSKLNPEKCIITTGRFLMLKNCPDSSQISSSSVVSLPPDAAFEAYDDDTIRQRSDSNKCWQAHEIHRGMIELGTCGSSGKQHWSATTVVENIAQVKQAAKETELKERGYDNWLTIQSKSSDKCIAVEGGEALKLAPIVLKDCDPSDEAQLWTHASDRATNDPAHTKIGMIRSKLDPDMCLVPSGSAQDKVPLILWLCDPAENFGSWTMYEEDSSIRSTKDNHVCLDTDEYKDDVKEDVFKHDIIVGTCPDGDSSTSIEAGQQWITKSAEESAAEAKAAAKVDDNEWMTIKSKASGNCITVEGGEALKLAPVVLNPCDQSDAQLWEHASARINADEPNHVKIGMIRSKLDPDMCLVPSGSAESDVPLILWNCDPSESFGAWTMYSNDSSIRTAHDRTVCLDTHELDDDVEDDEFKHDVIVGTCPDDDSSLASNSQQWVTTVI